MAANGEIELLTVTDRFDLGSRGVLLLPDFDVPNFDMPGCGRRKPFSENVSVVTPAGGHRTYQADFALTHLKIPDPNVAAIKRWRITVSLRSASKEAVPIGSKVFCSTRVRDALTRSKE